MYRLVEEGRVIITGLTIEEAMSLKMKMLSYDVLIEVEEDNEESPDIRAYERAREGYYPQGKLAGGGS